MSDKRPKCPNYPKYPCGDCPVCQVPPAAPHRLWSWPPGFHEARPTREAIAAHQGGAGRWLVTDPYGVKTLGAFDGDTFHVLMRWHVAGTMASEPTQPWKFEPYWKDAFTDEINRQRDRRDVEHEIHPAGWRELLRGHFQRILAPPAASNSPSQPQAPTPPQGPTAGPGIAPGGLDAAGFGSWPSEEEIEAHEANGGRWLAKIDGSVAWLGYFSKGKGDNFQLFWPAGRPTPSIKSHCDSWTFCPIDDNGDKLDAAPVLRGEDARRLVEQLDQVASPEEIARRRADARRRLAESEASAERLAVEKMTPSQVRVAGISGLLRARAEDEARRSAAAQGSEEFLQNEANRAISETRSGVLHMVSAAPERKDVANLAKEFAKVGNQDGGWFYPERPPTDHPHRATCKYVGLLDGKACACNLTKCVAAGHLVTESLGSGMEAPSFKDEHVQMALDARELAAVKAELALTTQSLVDVTNKLNEATLRIRDLKAAVRNEDKYAVPVGPAGFENDRIGRLTEEEKEIDRRLRDALKRCLECGHALSAHGITGCKHLTLTDGQRCWCRGNLATEPAVARILATLPDRSPDRRVLVVLRGLPGSGKSTVAQAIVDSDPGRWARVSKDDVRQMMVGPSGDLFRFVEDRAREVVVAKTAEEMAMSVLQLGLDVVVDATNLTNKALNSWRLAAMVVNYDGHSPVLVCERAVPTPVEECVARDARRGARSVGRAVIEQLAATIDVPLEDRNQEVGQ